ncbi:MAG: hypothetical protein ACREQ5_28390, partial [Candidatus Dormibacteria bacterium]
TLLVGAVAATALFGSLLDRALVATPAWDRLGVQAWADFSRHADLGTGNVVYPVGGILCWVLILAAAVNYVVFDRTTPRTLAVPVTLAVLGAFGEIATTIKAAPVMQGVAHLGNDQAALRAAFEQFTLWGVYVRGGFFALALLGSIWALVEAFRVPPRGAVRGWSL